MIGGPFLVAIALGAALLVTGALSNACPDCRGECIDPIAGGECRTCNGKGRMSAADWEALP